MGCRRASVGSIFLLCLSLDFNPEIAIGSDEATCFEQPLDNDCLTDNICHSDFRCLRKGISSTKDRKDRVCDAERECGGNIKKLGSDLTRKALLEEIKLAKNNDTCVRMEYCNLLYGVTMSSNAQNTGESLRNTGESLRTSQQVAADQGLLTQIRQWCSKLR